MAKRYSNIKWTKVGLRLLEEARLYWKERSEGRHGEECPLCEHYNRPGKATCCGCPVSQFAEDEGCMNTPYWDWHHNQTRKNAKEEWAFLSRLAANGRKVLGVKS